MHWLWKSEEAKIGEVFGVWKNALDFSILGRSFFLERIRKRWSFCSGKALLCTGTFSIVVVKGDLERLCSVECNIKSFPTYKTVFSPPFETWPKSLLWQALAPIFCSWCVSLLWRSVSPLFRISSSALFMQIQYSHQGNLLTFRKWQGTATCTFSAFKKMHRWHLFWDSFSESCFVKERDVT